MIFVFDRTVDDLMRAEELSIKIDQSGFASLTPTEHEEWMSGLRGCYNATDLARVDANTIEIAASLTAAARPVSIEPYTGWTRSCIPTQSAMARIRRNILALRSAITVPVDTPAVPCSLDVMDIQKANAIEQILYAVNMMSGNIGERMQRVNIVRAGEGVLL